MSLDKKINDLAQELGLALSRQRLIITTAESCTGGGIAQAITEVPGSSRWFECAFVTYSNHFKETLLSVDAELLQFEGAVSEAVVCAMASSAKAKAQADVAIAVSGIAGPGGATPNKPVGTVWLAWAWAENEVEAVLYCFDGSRAKVRKQAIQAALKGALSRVE